MSRATRVLPLTVLAYLLLATSSGYGAPDIDRTAVDWNTPMPAGGYVVHHASKAHFDGAKNAETIIQVWGRGPATSTPTEKR